MRTAIAQGLSCAWIPNRLPGVGLVMVTFCKWTLRITADGQLAPHAEPMLPSGDLAGDGPIYASDFVPYKPRGDVVVHAHAHAPGGAPVRYLPIAIEAGPLRKQLLVAGDREWKRGLLGHAAGEPTPFASMPLGWDRALGGAKDAANPIGRGRDGQRLPNVEWPDRLVQSPNDRIPPAGFGATAADWEPRRSMTGTYGSDYVAKYWPWLPPDFDYGHYNAAPRDQQIDGWMRGDETLVFTNLHRAHAKLALRLPGQRARLFVTFADGEFRDVPLRLDTLHCDLEADRVVLVWRGHTPVRGPMLYDVDHVLAELEPLAEPRPADHYLALRDARPATAAKPPTDPAAAEAAARAAAALEAKAAAMEAELAKAEAMFEAEAKEEQARLLEQGIDAAALQRAAPPPTLANAPTGALPVPPEIAKTNPAAAEPVLAPEDVAEFAQLDAEFEQEKQALTAPKKWTRERLLAAIAAGTDLAGEDAAGVDLSGCALAGAKLALLGLASSNLAGADLRGTDLRGAVLVGANLAGADLRGARLDRADCTGAAFAGARLAGASLAHARLDGQSFAGMDLSACNGESAHLAGADLSGCLLAGANFAKADLSGAKLVGARCAGAVLSDVRLHAADASQADLSGADLRGARGDDGARLAGADLRHARADGVVFEAADFQGADLRYASLRGALLGRSNLRQCDLSRADLERAALPDVDLAGARLLQTNLRYVSLERASLKGADMRGANAYGAGFWETAHELADLRDANLGSTLLAKR